jgi:glycolate oxidase FAD binding subunit
MTPPSLSTAPLSNDDCAAQLDEMRATIVQANESRSRLKIVGGGSKEFYGRRISGTTLKTSAYRGIIDYEPSELVMTARAGTRLSDIEKTLGEANQMLAFEPPQFSNDSTIGGVVVAGLSGPRRPFAGAVRDAVLGVKMMPSNGESLSFGGQVMKNVAGYDVARLMTGSMGTLGVLLEVSLRVAPCPSTQSTLAWETAGADAHQRMLELARRPLPITAMAYDGTHFRVRLAGHPSAVHDAQHELAADAIESNEFWTALNNQRLPFFQSELPLWRLSVAPGSALDLPGGWLWDWGGACRWLLSDQAPETIRASVRELGGHATLFRNGDIDSPFMPLPAVNLALHRQVKNAFDPHGIFNYGRMYAAV